VGAALRRSREGTISDKHFTRWAKEGIRERVFKSHTGDPDNPYLTGIPQVTELESGIGSACPFCQS
jgi:hypothetical protein